MTQKEGLGIGIVGMGAYFPEEVRSNDWWSKAFVDEQLRSYGTDIVAMVNKAAAERPNDVDPEIVKFTAMHEGDPFRGAKKRHVMGAGETSSRMEVAAGVAALTDARMTPSDIDLLITFSQVPDYPCPGNHALVAKLLGLSATAASMTVATDCASFVPHLKVASQLLHSGEYRNALIIQSNASSRVLNWKRPASINVGDGAIASVLSSVPKDLGYIGSFVGTRGEFHGAVRIAPEERADVPWYQGDVHKSQLVFQSMDHEAGRISSSRAVSLCREACEAVLTNCGYSAKDVAFFACSQPTAWFAAACAESLGIAPERATDTFDSYAHLMPASAPLNLWAARNAGKLRAGDLVLIYTPGAGFIQASALLRWAS